MNLDAMLIAYVVRSGRLTELQQAGVERTDFVDEYETVWRYILNQKRRHDSVPSEDVLVARFPDLELPRVKRRDVPILLHQLRQRKKYRDFITALHEAAATTTDFEDVDGALQTLQGNLNQLTTRSGASHLVNLFSTEASERMLEELRLRHSGRIPGVSTGLTTFDRMAGGLQKQRMVTVIGRPGIGKSWLDLLFVAQAVIQGRKVVLYPLEMTLPETAFRLYTLFTQSLWGARRTLKNYDLSSGRLSPQKVQRFLSALEDRFEGQLYVADVAHLSDPYTNERIEAEVEMLQPDMFWVDYLTLLKPPPSGNGESDWAGVRHLSNGIKNTAMRRNCIGGCSAQVNREAIRVKGVFLPRLEHIAYGDSIGQDADLVFSINRRKDTLYYALVKNRGGPEIGRTAVQFDPDQGILQELVDDDAAE